MNLEDYRRWHITTVNKGNEFIKIVEYDKTNWTYCYPTGTEVYYASAEFILKYSEPITKLEYLLYW